MHYSHKLSAIDRCWLNCFSKAIRSSALFFPSTFYIRIDLVLFMLFNISEM